MTGPEEEISRIELSASLQCMDFSVISEQIEVLNRWMDRYHIDVSDGNFIGNIVLSPTVVKGIIDMIDRPVDVHISVARPEVIVPLFLECGVSTICIHVENAEHQFFRISQTVIEKGYEMGIVLSPLTAPKPVEYAAGTVSRVNVMTVDPGFAGQQFISSMLPKIREVAGIRAAGSHRFHIEADGNVNEQTIPALAEAGADTMVLGSSGLFRDDVPLEESCRRIRSFCDAISIEQTTD